MRFPAWEECVLCLPFLLAPTLPSTRVEVEQQAIMVWDNKGQKCITEVTFDAPNLRLEAPMVNGMPDMKHAHLRGTKVTYVKDCGHIEIQSNEVKR